MRSNLSSLRPSTLVVNLALAILAATAPVAQANYKQKAEAQTDFMQAHFYDAKAKRYHGTYPLKPGDLPYEFMWGNGVALTALVGAARFDAPKYRASLDAFRDGLDASYWDPEVPVPGYNAYCSGPRGTDKYYDDNEWMVLAFAEAYETTHDRVFLRDAERTQKFVLSGWDDVLGGGIYWKLDHKSKNTCSNAPGAAAALRLAQVGGAKEQIAWATRICDWTKAHLQDPADGLYWDNEDLSGHIGKAKFTYNTALMIRAYVLFYQLQGDQAALTEAKRLADAGLKEWTDPATGSLQRTEDSPLFTHLLCESLLRLYDVTGDLKYLNAVRRNAAFAYRHARDLQGGYWDKWTSKNPAEHEPGARKSLIDTAATARMFWLLAPYDDAEELYEKGFQAARTGRASRAASYFQQAAASDPDARTELALTDETRAMLAHYDETVK